MPFFHSKWEPVKLLSITVIAILMVKAAAKGALFRIQIHRRILVGQNTKYKKGLQSFHIFPFLLCIHFLCIHQRTIIFRLPSNTVAALINQYLTRSLQLHYKYSGNLPRGTPFEVTSYNQLVGYINPLTITVL